MFRFRRRSLREMADFLIKQIKQEKIQTRMHSSRMRTARLLPVFPSMHCSGGCTCSGVAAQVGVPAWRGCTCPGGCTCLEGLYLPGGVPAREGVPARGGGRRGQTLFVCGKNYSLNS